ncbi:MAG: SDR family oxidoreductase [Myxococcales bacterium]|nr:SDR family oxidoreductase [Myxococcales bacterium]
MSTRRILVTGATGYIGGRLVAALQGSGDQIRCMARHPIYLRPRVAPTTEVVHGDVLDLESLRAALKGVDVAYYLVHSMGSSEPFSASDRLGAENFARAALEAGTSRIIYLGGLGGGTDLSEHLASRQEVGDILRGSGVPTLELRASIIIGSGSLSFELVRSLVEKLPVMLLPRWVRTQTQPIAVEDVIHYLVDSLELEMSHGEVVEIGGTDRVSYEEIMKAYAEVRGLRRLMIPVPVLTPWLSSLWLHFITPIYARVGRKLIEGVRNETLADTTAAHARFDIKPLGVVDAIRRALKFEEAEFARTRWTDALSSGLATSTWAGVRVGPRVFDARSTGIAASPERVYSVVARIGGDQGWYAYDWLWRLRAALDLMAGGIGMRRGRRHPTDLAVGDTVDFWRVEKAQPNALVRLHAEMKMPGEAWLQFEMADESDGSARRTHLTQTAIFEPRGLTGRLYWYAVYPLHRLVFEGMLRTIKRRAAQEAASAGEGLEKRGNSPVHEP